MHERRKASSLAIGLRLSCTNTSKWDVDFFSMCMLYFCFPLWDSRWQCDKHQWSWNGKTIFWSEWTTFYSHSLKCRVVVRDLYKYIALWSIMFPTKTASTAQWTIICWGQQFMKQVQSPVFNTNIVKYFHRRTHFETMWYTFTIVVWIGEYEIPIIIYFFLLNQTMIRLS